MSRSIVIGITSGLDSGGMVPGWPTSYVNHDIASALQRAGALPFVVPLTVDRGKIAEYVQFVDALVLAGETLSIRKNVFMDEVVMKESDPPLMSSNPVRYAYESLIIEEAYSKKVPILGICRGHQVLGVALGGSVRIGDVNIDNPTMHHQAGKLEPDEAAHEISISTDSELYQFLGVDSIRVNSYHREVLETLPPGFRVVATSEDGFIEAIEGDGDGFVLTVQFHPEMLKGSMWAQFFERFVQKAALYKR